MELNPWLLQRILETTNPKHQLDGSPPLWLGMLLSAGEFIAFFWPCVSVQSLARQKNRSADFPNIMNPPWNRPVPTITEVGSDGVPKGNAVVFPTPPIVSYHKWSEVRGSFALQNSQPTFLSGSLYKWQAAKEKKTTFKSQDPSNAKKANDWLPATWGN